MTQIITAVYLVVILAQGVEIAALTPLGFMTAPAAEPAVATSDAGHRYNAEHPARDAGRSWPLVGGVFLREKVCGVTVIKREIICGYVITNSNA